MSVSPEDEDSLAKASLRLNTRAGCGPPPASYVPASPCFNAPTLVFVSWQGDDDLTESESEEEVNGSEIALPCARTCAMWR